MPRLSRQDALLKGVVVWRDKKARKRQIIKVLAKQVNMSYKHLLKAVTIRGENFPSIERNFENNA